MKGFSFLVCVGNYGGFHFSTGGAWHLCLGWVAFTIFPFDLEVVLESLTDDKFDVKKCINKER